MFCKKSSRGFSLIEMMVVVAILGILSFGMMTMMTQMSQSVARIEDKQSLLDLKNVMMMELNDPRACANAFAGQNPQRLIQVNSLVTAQNQPWLQVQQIWNGLQVATIELENVNVANTATATGRMTLRVRMGQGRTAQPPSPVEIPIQVTTDASRRIAACSSSASGTTGTNASCTQPPDPSWVSNNNWRSYWCSGWNRSVSNLQPIPEESSCQPVFSTTHAHGARVSATRSTDYFAAMTYNFTCINGNWILVSTGGDSWGR